MSFPDFWTINRMLEAMPKWHLRGNTAMSQVRRGVDSIFGRHRLGIPITFFFVGNLLNSSEYGGLKEASTQEFVENKPEDMRILWEFSLRKGLVVVVVFCYTLHLLLADGNLVPLNLWQLDFLKLWASWIISDHGPPTCEYHHWSRHETCCPMTDPVQLLTKIPLRKVVKIRLLNYETEPEKATASSKSTYVYTHLYIPAASNGCLVGPQLPSIWHLFVGFFSDVGKPGLCSGVSTVGQWHHSMHRWSWDFATWRHQGHSRHIRHSQSREMITAYGCFAESFLWSWNSIFKRQVIPSDSNFIWWTVDTVTNGCQPTYQWLCAYTVRYST